MNRLAQYATFFRLLKPRTIVPKTPSHPPTAETRTITAPLPQPAHAPQNKTRTTSTIVAPTRTNLAIPSGEDLRTFLHGGCQGCRDNLVPRAYIGA